MKLGFIFKFFIIEWVKKRVFEWLFFKIDSSFKMVLGGGVLFLVFILFFFIRVILFVVYKDFSLGLVF